MVEIKKIRRFCESLETDLKRSEFVNELCHNTYVRKVMNEMLFNDVAPAVGEIATAVLEGAYPAQVSRQICRVYETTQPKVRIFKTTGGKAARIAQGVPPPLFGPTPTYIDIDVNIELGTRVEYTLSAIEDTPRSVQRQIEADAGQVLAVAETQEVENVLDNIPTSDLAGGNTQSPGTSNKFTYDDVLKLLKVLDGEGYYKRGSRIVCVMNPESLYDALLSDDKLIKSIYKTAVELNLPGRPIVQDSFGITYFASSVIDAGDVYLINADYAIALVIRRDISVRPFETTVTSGFDALERIGIGVLNTKAVAKMTGA
ncbi:MAG: phage major capsid protein [Thermoproteota archaeon]